MTNQPIQITFPYDPFQHLSNQITNLGELLMADLTALNTAVANLQTQLATDETTLTAVNTAVADLVTAVGNGDQAGVDAATQALVTATSSLATDETALQSDAAADPGPATPAS